MPCGRWWPSAPHSSPSPHFGPCLLWPNGRPSQQLLNSCKPIQRGPSNHVSSDYASVSWPDKLQYIGICRTGLCTNIQFCPCRPAVPPHGWDTRWSKKFSLLFSHDICSAEKKVPQPQPLISETLSLIWVFAVFNLQHAKIVVYKTTAAAAAAATTTITIISLSLLHII